MNFLRHRKKGADQRVMNILVAGGGLVGETLTQLLAAGEYNVTLIDTDTAMLEELKSRYDLMTLQGNCASMATLREAGVEQADLLIATTGSDELNLLCCTTARALNKNIHTIARIRNPEYTEQAYSMRDAFGLSLVFNPELQAAVEIDRLLKYPAFLKRDSFAKGRVEIVELKIGTNSPLCNVSMIDMYKIVKCRVLVCTILRGEEVITPTGQTVLMKDDRIFVTASTSDLSALLKNLGISTHRMKHVFLAGGGRISYYLAGRLLKDHVDVRIVEKDPERCRQLSALLPDAEIIHGDVAELETLEEERFGSFDALVSLTDLDELNMIMSLYGTNRKIPRVITKLGNAENTNVINSLPIGSVVCPRKLCCNTVVRYIRAVQNQTGAATTIHTIADGHAEAIEFPVDDTTLHCGEALKDIKLKPHILIVCISRGLDTEIPGGMSSFKPGDSVVIVSSNETPILQLNDIFD